MQLFNDPISLHTNTLKFIVNDHMVIVIYIKEVFVL